jgi:predicted metal-dependent hydrolase
LKKQREYREAIPQIIAPTFEDNSILPYLGKNYRVKINKNQHKNKIRFVDSEFVADITASNISEESKLQIKRLYEEWLLRMAQKILKRKVETYAQRVGVNIQKISVKNSLKSRWASLTKNDSINFNMHLAKAPQDVIDYIVLHEICHLKIRGHSHHYWALLYRYMSNYQSKIEWLNINGSLILAT